MKKTILSIVTMLALGVISVSAQTITGFGTGDGFTTSPNGFTGTVGATSYSISGTEGSDFFGSIPTVGITSFATTRLQLTGTITANPGSAVNIELFDGNGDSGVYAGFWSSFTLNTPSTANLLYVSKTGAFNGAGVNGFILSTAPGTATITITLDNLAAVPVVVPEPSAFAAIAGVAVLGAVAYRRRRVAA